MKMVKKILLGLAATAAVVTFVSCAEKNDENNMLDVKGDSCSIDYTNETDGYSRGFQTLKTKHVDGICKITINKNSAKDGVLGYIFNFTENADKTDNFTIAGVRINGTKLEGYVSDYKNVGGEYLSKGSDFCDAAGIQVGENNCEATCSESFSGIWKTLKTGVGNEVSVWVELVANDSTSVNRQGTKNTYTVNFYDHDPERTLNSDSIVYNASTTKLASATGIALNNPLEENVEHFSATKGQSKFGFYANVYGKQTLKGTWKIDSIYHEAEEIEE